MSLQQIGSLEQALVAPRREPRYGAENIDLGGMFDEIRTALNQAPTAARDALDRLEKVLRLAGGSNAGCARGGLAPWQMRKVEAYIEERLAHPIPLNVLAELVSLSPNHFSRAFKKSYGKPPHAHILRRRIARAQRLMLRSVQPLSQIALACGFVDQSHFANRFRCTVGVPPNAWRRANIDPEICDGPTA